MNVSPCVYELIKKLKSGCVARDVKYIGDWMIQNLEFNVRAGMVSPGTVV